MHDEEKLPLGIRALIFLGLQLPLYLFAGLLAGMICEGAKIHGYTDASARAFGIIAAWAMAMLIILCQTFGKELLRNQDEILSRQTGLKLAVMEVLSYQDREYLSKKSPTCCKKHQ